MLALAASPILASENVEANKVLDITEGSLTPSVMKQIKELFKTKAFIDISPKHRDIASDALPLFKEIFTIESDHTNFLKSTKQFKSQKKVHCYEGNADQVLNKILPEIHDRVLFWIDGRNENSVQKINNIIDAIFSSKQVDGVLVIGHVLSSKGLSHDQSGTCRSIKNQIKTKAPEYEFWVIGDYIIAYPSKDLVMPSPIVKAITESSLFDGSNDGPMEVIAAEEIIMQSSNRFEKKEISLFENRSGGLAPKQHVWSGLRHLENKDYSRASSEFHRAISSGEDHWRVYWYLAVAESKRKHYKEAKSALKHVMIFAPHFEKAKELYIQIEVE